MNKVQTHDGGSNVHRLHLRVLLWPLGIKFEKRWWVIKQLVHLDFPACHTMRTGCDSDGPLAFVVCSVQVGLVMCRPATRVVVALQLQASRREYHCSPKPNTKCNYRIMVVCVLLLERVQHTPRH